MPAAMSAGTACPAGMPAGYCMSHTPKPKRSTSGSRGNLPRRGLDYWAEGWRAKPGPTTKPGNRSDRRSHSRYGSSKAASHVNVLRR